jgi:ankyrin repeat protein
MYANDWGCDINAVDEDGDTIFHHHAFAFSTLRAVMNLGLPVDWNRRNKKRQTFLHCGINWLEDPRLLQMFLLHSQSGINARDYEGCSPLHRLLEMDEPRFYIHYNLCRSVQLLLDFGADRALKDHMGRSAADIGRKQLIDAQSEPYEDEYSIQQSKSLIEILIEYATVAIDAHEVDLRLDGDQWLNEWKTDMAKDKT